MSTFFGRTCYPCSYIQSPRSLLPRGRSNEEGSISPSAPRNLDQQSKASQRLTAYSIVPSPRPPSPSVAILCETPGPITLRMRGCDRLAVGSRLQQECEGNNLGERNGVPAPNAKKPPTRRPARGPLPTFSRLASHDHYRNLQRSRCG